MKNNILTKNGIYSYTPINLYLGRKIIDKDICRCNLLELKEILDINKIKFGLIFGTLLGAIREGNFIEYDEDVDIYILDEYREKVLGLLYEFREHGLEVARYESDLLTIIKNNDYIDIYFFKKKFFQKRACMQYSYNATYFRKFRQINLFNTKFNVPNNYKEFLIELYGKDWMIPKRNSHAEAKTYPSKIKEIAKKIKTKILNKFIKQKYEVNYDFSKKLNKLILQIKKLANTEQQYIVYGAGNFSKLISSILKSQIIAFVDKNSNIILSEEFQGRIHSPENLPIMQYDKIIISVLGRENEIIEYLTKKLNIDIQKIIVFNLENN